MCETIRKLKDISVVLNIHRSHVFTALKVLRSEKYTRKTICDALNRNVNLLRRQRAMGQGAGLIIHTVRNFARFEQNVREWSKPTGNHVRDTLLEVGEDNYYKHPEMRRKRESK